MDSSQRASLRIIILVFGVPLFLFALLGFPILMFYTVTSNMHDITIWSVVIAVVVLVAMVLLLYKLRTKQGDERSVD